jgi:tripartite-type tricarboxylate transporter receptor subunit TctC
MKRTALTVALGLLGLIGGNSPAPAQAVYPDKPLQLIVPFPPGGASDVVARIIGGELETRLGKPVIIMNRPGGGTTIAAKEVARAAPDGYTLFFSSNSSFTLPAAVKESVPYDAAKDFEPIGQTGKITLALVTYQDNPVKDVAALVAEAKANPDKLSLASFGVATVSHFAGELFKSAAGIKMVHLPYKGSAPAMNDLIGKHIQYHVDTVIAVKPQIEAGTVKVLAVFSGKRTPYLPDVPTLAELGYPGVLAELWYGMLAPAATPREIVARVHDDMTKALALAEVKSALAAQGMEVAPSSPDEMAALMRRDAARWAAVVKRQGIKAQ